MAGPTTSISNRPAYPASSSSPIIHSSGIDPSPGTRLFLAEPSGAAETFASLQRGERVTDFTPDTVCDGLRGTLGAINFRMLRNHHAQVLTVDDAATIAAMRLFWQRTKQIVEPSSATVLAAVLANPALFASQRVGVVLSGGNVDPDTLPTLFG